MTIKRPDNGEITKAVFRDSVSNEIIMLTLTLGAENPVIISYNNKDLNKDDREFAINIHTYYAYAVKNGVNSTTPDRPDLIWNVLEEIDQFFPGHIVDLKFETKEMDSVPGRVY